MKTERRLSIEAAVVEAEEEAAENKAEREELERILNEDMARWFREDYIEDEYRRLDEEDAALEAEYDDPHDDGVEWDFAEHRFRYQ